MGVAVGGVGSDLAAAAIGVTGRRDYCFHRRLCRDAPVLAMVDPSQMAAPKKSTPISWLISATSPDHSDRSIDAGCSFAARKAG